MKIKITNFGKRHFDSKFGGTKILDMTVEEFEKAINEDLSWIDLDTCKKGEQINMLLPEVVVHEGYAPFCKLIAIKNFTDARIGSLPITLENYQYIRSGYSARRDSELPVFSRWLELPLGKPKAEWLMLILYSKEQIEKEWRADLENKINTYENDHGSVLTKEDREGLKKLDAFKYEFEGVDFDYGVVAILGQSYSTEEPMKPETMIRNALGVKEGGSGVPLDKEKYLNSVDFWSKNCTVK